MQGSHRKHPYTRQKQDIHSTRAATASQRHKERLATSLKGIVQYSGTTMLCQNSQAGFSIGEYQKMVNKKKVLLTKQHFFDPILKGAVRQNDYKGTSTHEP